MYMYICIICIDIYRDHSVTLHIYHASVSVLVSLSARACKLRLYGLLNPSQIHSPSQLQERCRASRAYHRRVADGLDAREARV